MNEQERALFESLRGSAVGEKLLAYLDRLIAKACDSRTWGEHEDKTHANKVADFITENLVVHLREKKATQNKEDDEYE